jgi:hypothetical protein
VLYRRILKDDFEKLPRALKMFHAFPGGGRALGTVTVRHANRLLARIAGFPPSGEDIPMELTVSAGENREVWTRRFGGVELNTAQWMEGELLVEQSGPVRLYIAVRGAGSGMHFRCSRARVWGIPFPIRVEADVRGDDDSWEFEVRISGVGSYGGVMRPEP